MNFKTSLILTALSAFSICTFAQQEKTIQDLTVYTYKSFASDWGAGPKVKQGFEQQYPQCQLNYVPFDSSGLLFNRLRLEGKKTKADVVLGLDNHLLQEAIQSELFSEHKVDLSQLSLPVAWQDQRFLPYDFGRYAFVYDKTKLTNPPKSLQELVERQDLRVIYQDPRTSGVGRGLVVWLNSVYPQQEVAQAWQTLAKHTVTVGKGWSESYGAFLKGEADLVLSYSTSPLYHLLNEQKDQYQATDFTEGGVLQIELAAKIANKENACSDLFMDYLISPQAQKNIVKNNVMLSVTSAPIEPHYDALKQHQLKSKVFDSSNVSGEQLKQWISQWQANLSK